MSRRLTAYEIYCMTAASNVYNAKIKRDSDERQALKSDEGFNAVKWAEEHPKAAELLAEVERMIANE